MRYIMATGIKEEHEVPFLSDVQLRMASVIA